MKLVYQVNTSSQHTVKEILKEKLNISDRLLKRLKVGKLISLNSVCIPINTIVHNGDLIEISLDYEEDNTNILPISMPLDIIYEDESYLVVNKPAGMAVHPSILHYSDSLSNGIKYYFDTINLKKKVRPVNRLDKDTSGLVIFAKNEYIQECLIQQMKDSIFRKKYVCICKGQISPEAGEITAPIARKKDSIIERCVSPNGTEAITHYEVIDSNKQYSIVSNTLKTGRTHQIRIHMQYIGHPIIGDTLYGSPSTLIHRQALHASYISFLHPISRKKVEYTAPMPSDMQNVINYILAT